MTSTIAIYGATGHTGGYLIAELARRGVRMILVGRDAQRLQAAAADSGAEVRVAALDDHAALVAAFSGADAVISSLSAYVDHGDPVVTAAIDAGAHYLDISGEQRYVRHVFDEYDATAQEAGVTLLPGMTDNNVSADLLAYVTSRRVRGPAEIVLSHKSLSGGNGSKGSARTVLASKEWFASGGWHYQDGAWSTGPGQHTELTFPDASAPTAVSKFPQVPVVMIPRHSTVSRVEGVVDTAIAGHLAGFNAEAVDAMPDEPSADLRYYMVVDTYGVDGQMVRGLVSGVDSYRDSALLAVEAAIRVAAGTTKAGALTPAEAFDPVDFLDAMAPHGITWQIEG